MNNYAGTIIRPIATGRLDRVQRSQLLTYIRLLDAAENWAASADGFFACFTGYPGPEHQNGIPLGGRPLMWLGVLRLAARRPARAQRAAMKLRLRRKV